jgi:beta-lactamase superfamily II metal-dependent hydrolase
MTTVFAGYPSIFVYAKPQPEKATTNQQIADRKKHLLWGDEIELLTDQTGQPVKDQGWLKISSRNTIGWVRENDIQTDRLLEVNFVDCGQGDSQFLVTPENKIVLVDSGQYDHLYRFLRYRYISQPYGTQTVPEVHFDAAVISHFDADHYQGLRYLLESPNFTFQSIYHNGVVERAGGDELGPTQKYYGRYYLTDVVADQDRLVEIINDPALFGRKENLALLRDAINTGRVGDIRMICSEDQHLPGFDGSAVGSQVEIQVLGPVPEKNPGGKRILRSFSSTGKTKNGHSVVLLVKYGQVKIMLAGDMNDAAEQYLLKAYSGSSMDPEIPEKLDKMAETCRPIFGADIFKFPHHGSNDFCRSFMKSIDPAATVVSSGDEESYCHPRAEALGAIGKLSRGDWPMIFSTELARSSSDKRIQPQEVIGHYLDLKQKIASAPTEESKSKYELELKKLLSPERTVSVYGMINVRTDGNRVVIAQKLEKKAGNKTAWDIHQLEPDSNGVLVSVM